ncbi:hypothetical protein C8P66_14126 [Humitalea rosea]|uniref:Uncharacterized protein n=1 Tax=Humitalea rosea TaxID=990373 RepID=A0A2W7IID9_9PROT|nr:hypothetical protein [Humitalea rosea]PZW37749.1 hypothetical protein C8P66_14126 [Humitalea rosea]
MIQTRIPQRYAVVCGLLRFPLEAALTLRKLFRLRAEGLIDGIVLSTWTPEVDREVAFITWARSQGVTVIHTLEHPDRGPTMLYTQARAVWLGLEAVPEGADVLKLRTDKTLDRIDGFVPLLAEGTSGASFLPGPHSAYSRKIAVLWAHVGRPFYFGDQAYFSTKKDATAALNFDARFHLTMMGLNPETKWWIRPICERFAFWREFFQNIDQFYSPNFIRLALSTPSVPRPPDIFYDFVAATLRGMADGFLFTVHNPAPVGLQDTGFRYSALFDMSNHPNSLAYEGLAAGRKTIALREGDSLPALVEGRVEPCPLSEGVRAALARQEKGPPQHFDSESFREWIEACGGSAQAAQVAPRPYVALPPLGASVEVDGTFLIEQLSRAAGGASEAESRDLLERLERQLGYGLPVARALFRSALEAERAGAPAEMVNAAICIAAQQKINEATLEFAMRALEGAPGVDAALADKLLDATCSRGVVDAFLLRALLLGWRPLSGTPAAVPAEAAMAEARAHSSLDAAFLDAASGAGGPRFDAESMAEFARSQGAAPYLIENLQRRMARLIAAGIVQPIAHAPDAALYSIAPTS